jgi:hypothetical protein
MEDAVTAGQWLPPSTSASGDDEGASFPNGQRTYTTGISAATVCSSIRRWPRRETLIV